MGKVSCILITLQILTQVHPLEFKRDAVVPLLQQAQKSESVPAATKQLLDWAKNVEQPPEIRTVAVEALGKLKDPAALEELRDIALTPPNPALSEYDQQRAKGVSDAASEAYWRIELNTIVSENDQEALLLSLLRNIASEPKSQQARDWAAQELASREFEQHLMEVIAYYQSVWGTNSLSMEHQWLVRKKLELLKAHPTRFEALKAAFSLQDDTQTQLLHQWAVEEMTALSTPEVQQYFVEQAKGLQVRYHDERQERIDRAEGFHAADRKYRGMITGLREMGWSTEDLNAADLFPDRFFLFFDQPTP